MKRVGILSTIVILLVAVTAVSAQDGGVCALFGGAQSELDCYTRVWECTYNAALPDCTVLCDYDTAQLWTNYNAIRDACSGDASCNTNCYVPALTCDTACAGDTLCVAGCLADLLTCMDQALCPGATGAVPGDNCGFSSARVDQYYCAAPVAVFCQDQAIAVYAIDASGGSHLFSVPLADTVPASSPRVLAQAGGVALYRLSTGEYQVNAFDDSGNPYVLVWDGCPVSRAYLIK